MYLNYDFSLIKEWEDTCMYENILEGISIKNKEKNASQLLHYGFNM